MALITSMRDWAELNDDLLNLILPNLLGADRLSFSLVCRHWNAFASTSPYRYSPCLEYYYWRTHTWIFYQYNTFFHVTFPHLENEELRCSKYGWMLMSRYDDTLFFFDPTNNRKLELPPKVDKYYYRLSFFNPPTSPECVVVGVKTMVDSRKVEICTLKLGDDEWDTMEFPINEPGEDFRVLLESPVSHCGLIYFLSKKGDVAILDIKQRRLDFNFKCLCPESDDMYEDIKEKYLVKVNGDEALYCVLVFDDDREVNVLRLSLDMKWDLVEEGIGDQVFYLSHMSSFGDKAPCKSMENTIYFPTFHGDVPVFYSLSDAKYHSIDEDYLEGNAYGLKRLNHSAWLMPMPAQKVSTTLSWL